MIKQELPIQIVKMQLKQSLEENARLRVYER